MRKFKLIFKKYSFNLTEENYCEVIAHNGLRDQITELLEHMTERRLSTAWKGDFRIDIEPTESEIALFDLIEKSNERETDGDYLTAAERQELVNKFLEAYKDIPAVMKNFPADKDLDSQYTYIVDEF
jgi:hypothetical protein